MSTFPDTLPQPRADQYALTPTSQVLRSNFTSGRVRSRRISYAQDTRVSLGWVFTAAQMSTFRDWFYNGDTGAAAGAAYFDIALDIGDGLTTIEARFVDTYAATYLPGIGYRVTATLEVRDNA